MRTFVLACAIFLPIAAEAQDVGIKGGTSARRGFVGGVFVLLPGNQYGGWQIEALGHRNGAEAPVLLHLDVFQADPFAIYVAAGPSVAFNRRLGFGFHAGAGIEYGPLSVDARYVWGRRSAFQDSDLDGSSRNRTFAVTAGIRLGR